jgi:hypothetical protein
LKKAVPHVDAFLIFKDWTDGLGLDVLTDEGAIAAPIVAERLLQCKVRECQKDERFQVRRTGLTPIPPAFPAPVQGQSADTPRARRVRDKAGYD